MNIGLFGGSFDPVHKGHIKLAREALHQVKLNKLYWIPAGRSPHKPQQKTTKDAYRLKMVRLAVGSSKRQKVLNWEIRRGGLSYSISTIRKYKKKHPRHNLFFILGSDVLKGFHRWKQPHHVIKLVQLVVAMRPESKKIPNGTNAIVLKGKFPDYCSSDIRAKLKKGQSISRIVPGNIERIIKKNKLYV